jgi:hypothetical protein
MLFTILVMAVAMSLEPFRVGMTVLMLNRPRPILQLLAFLSGGFAMGLTVGLIVLLAFRRLLLGSGYVTLPRMQILTGSVALVFATLLAAKIFADRISQRGSPGTEDGPGRLESWTRRLLDGRSLWVAGVAGLGIALPSVDYLGALAIILASGAAVTKQLGALLMFHVVAFALVEIPVFAYLVAPQQTRAVMNALQEWIRSRRRVEVVALFAGVGSVLLAFGLTGL